MHCRFWFSCFCWSAGQNRGTLVHEPYPLRPPAGAHQDCPHGCNATGGSHRQNRWVGWAIATLFGLALSWRSNFLFLVPLAFSALVQKAGAGRALELTAVALLAFAGVTVPLFLFDPAHFAPLATLGKLQYPDVLPSLEIALPGLTGVLSVGLAFQNNADIGVLMRNSFFVLIFPVVSVVTLSSISMGHPELRAFRVWHLCPVLRSPCFLDCPEGKPRMKPL